jgi:hypothetical protein
MVQHLDQNLKFLFNATVAKVKKITRKVEEEHHEEGDNERFPDCPLEQCLN